jgi:hypothetical protein
MYKLIFRVFIINASLLAKVFGQNLIVNPGAEVGPIIPIPGWTQVSGNWSESTQVTAHGGSKHFYAGAWNSPDPIASELYQDVDVSGNAASIDAGTASYTFSAWMRIFGFGNDKGNIIVEYRDASSAVLTSYNTGFNTTTTWKNYTDTRNAPVGTRTIRIRLISTLVSGSDSDGYMDDLSLISNGGLPIKIINFTADYINPSASLSWSTASEINNDYFTVERSEDGMQWSEVEIVDGAGNSSSPINYAVEDLHPFNKISYYRLKQTDFDGSFTYSPTVVIRTTSDHAFTIYPNPANHVLHITNPQGDELNFSFVNNLGQQVYLPYTQEGNTTTFHLYSLSRGMYMLRIQNKNLVHFEKVVFE